MYSITGQVMIVDFMFAEVFGPLMTSINTSDKLMPSCIAFLHPATIVDH